MASRWMAPKLIKMKRPYTDAQQMWLRGNETHRGPAPEVLDALADLAMSGGYDTATICPDCHQAAFAKSGQCVACELYVPSPPRTLTERQETRRLAVAVEVHTRHVKPSRKRKPTARERRLARMGLR